MHIRSGDKMKKMLILISILAVLLVACPKAPEAMEKKETVVEKMVAGTVVSFDSDKVEVVIDDLAFQPTAIHIKKGATITWLNRDSVAHTVALTDPKTNKVIESEVLDPGDRYSYTLTDESVWHYICGIHPFMKGTIIVGNPPELSTMMAAAPDTPAPTITSITPNSAPETGKVKVTVKGTNFVEGTTVFFHHLFGDVKFVDSTMLEVTVPEHYPLKMDVIVTNPDGDHYTFADGFEFTAVAKAEMKEEAKTEFQYKEERTIHFVSSAPKHGEMLDASPAVVSVSFNFPIVKGSTIQILDLQGNVVAEGDLAISRLGLVVQPPALKSGTYEVRYHAVWLGGSSHDGKFWFVVK